MVSSLVTDCRTTDKTGMDLDSLNDNSDRPRVVLLTLPGLFGALAINRLAAQFGSDLVGVGLSNRIYRKRGAVSGIVTFQRRTGWNYLMYNALLANVSWQYLRLRGKPSGLRDSRTQVRYLNDVNAASTLTWLDGLAPDYIVSCFFNQWIGSDVRSRMKRSCLNMHPGLIPALRGPDPAFRAIERGLKQTGITIHDVTDEIDEGTCHYQEAVDVPEGSSVFGLYAQLIETGADRLARYVAGELNAGLSVSPVDAAGDYTTYPTAQEVAALLRSGRQLITLSEWRQVLSGIR